MIPWIAKRLGVKKATDKLHAYIHFSNDKSITTALSNNASRGFKTAGGETLAPVGAFRLDEMVHGCSFLVHAE